MAISAGEPVSSVVTGGAKGVGRAIVERLHELGPVIVVDVVAGPVDGGRAANGPDPEAG